jgi:hypothetical protein
MRTIYIFFCLVHIIIQKQQQLAPRYKQQHTPDIPSINRSLELCCVRRRKNNVHLSIDTYRIHPTNKEVGVLYTRHLGIILWTTDRLTDRLTRSEASVVVIA